MLNHEQSLARCLIYVDKTVKYSLEVVLLEKFMSVWSWLSDIRRKEILDMYRKHVERVYEVVMYAKDLIEALVKGDINLVQDEWKKVFVAERAADDMKRETLSQLTKGAFHPIDREEIVRLILTTDDVADYAKAWSRRVILYIPNKLPEDIGLKLLSMASKVLEAVNIIKLSAEVVTKDPRKALELADKIEAIEEEVDDIRHELFKNILTFCDNAKPSLCILAKEIMDSIENAADKCENVGDLFRRLALMII
jgi:predicted phosphate transport protein (TIGR00153 family)